MHRFPSLNLFLLNQFSSHVPPLVITSSISFPGYSRDNIFLLHVKLHSTILLIAGSYMSELVLSNILMVSISSFSDMFWSLLIINFFSCKFWFLYSIFGGVPALCRYFNAFFVYFPILWHNLIILGHNTNQKYFSDRFFVFTIWCLVVWLFVLFDLTSFNFSNARYSVVMGFISGSAFVYSFWCLQDFLYDYMVVCKAIVCKYSFRINISIHSFFSALPLMCFLSIF